LVEPSHIRAENYYQRVQART